MVTSPTPKVLTEADLAGLPRAVSRNINTTGYVLLSEGEYSDYQNSAFRVLKAFSFAETRELFTAQWTSDHAWRSTPSPNEYIAWLSAQGFIEDADDIQEIHLGSYEFDDGSGPDEDLAQTVFYPSGLAALVSERDALAGRVAELEAALKTIRNHSSVILHQIEMIDAALSTTTPESKP